MSKRVTTHNGRSGKNGVYLAKHLDGPDGKAAKKNGLLQTWHCDPDKGKPFEQVEADFYERHFRRSLDAQNEKHVKGGHKKRCKTMDEYRENRQTCPEESLYYLGGIDDHADPKILWAVTVEFLNWRNREYPQVKLLDMALHIEDGAPHIHERHVWIAHDKDGNEIVSQEQALREMGVQPPKPGKVDRYNNAKMAYTAACREKMIEIARAHGIQVTDEPREAGKAGLAQARYKTQDERRKAQEARKDAQDARDMADMLQWAVDGLLRPGKAMAVIDAARDAAEASRAAERPSEASQVVQEGKRSSYAVRRLAELNKANEERWADDDLEKFAKSVKDAL